MEDAVQPPFTVHKWAQTILFMATTMLERNAVLEPAQSAQQRIGGEGPSSLLHPNTPDFHIRHISALTFVFVKTKLTSHKPFLVKEVIVVFSWICVPSTNMKATGFIMHISWDVLVSLLRRYHFIHLYIKYMTLTNKDLMNKTVSNKK